MKKYFVLILICFLSTCISSFAQSVNDANKIKEWLKKQPGSIIITGDICDISNSTGPYDPQCFETELLELTKLKIKSRNEPIIAKVFDNEIQRLKKIKNHWNSLNSKQKQSRMALVEKFRNEIKKKNNDVKSGLLGISTNVNFTQNERSIARNILTDLGTKGCIWGCVCVQAEGCPCCGYDIIIKNIFGNIYRGF